MALRSVRFVRFLGVVAGVLLTTLPARAGDPVEGADLVKEGRLPRELREGLAAKRLTSAELDRFETAAPAVEAWAKEHPQEWRAADKGLAPDLPAEKEREALARLRRLAVWPSTGVSFEEFLALRIKVAVNREIASLGGVRGLREAAPRLAEFEKQVNDEAAKGHAPPDEIAEARRQLAELKSLIPLAQVCPEENDAVFRAHAQRLGEALSALDRLPTSDPAEDSRRLPSVLSVATWHDGKRVTAAVMNSGAETRTLLAGLKAGDCEKRHDRSWVASMKPVTFPGRSVTILRPEGPVCSSFLVFRDQVDGQFDEHYGGQSLEHLVAHSWVYANAKLLSRHLCKRGEALEVPWTASDATVICTFRRSRHPWLSVKEKPGVRVLSNLDPKECDAAVKKLLGSMASMVRSEDSVIFQSEPSAKAVDFVIDSSRIATARAIQIDVDGRWTNTGGGGTSVGEFLVYDPDMKVIDPGE